MVSAVASPEFCVSGAQVWLRKKTENDKCRPIPYHPGLYIPEHALLH